MVRKKNSIFNHFYLQYLVLLTMVPRNSLRALAQGDRKGRKSLLSLGVGVGGEVGVTGVGVAIAGGSGGGSVGLLLLLLLLRVYRLPTAANRNTHTIRTIATAL